ncbi:DUF2490 domain-containing protein [Saccharicrinis sp. GN24d3]|uniref:DUF2490 domain-containing protein n=1 Tax=Saccharicrinis sp. GN24d3 TaxID=3458416 RepID=UPI004036C872
MNNNSVKLLKYIGCLIFILWSGKVFASDRFEDSHEIWQELNIYHKISTKFTANLLYNNMYNSSSGNGDWFLQPGLKYNVSQKITLEAIFRKEFFKEGDKWTYENRSMLRVGGSTKIGQWSFRNRHRIEFRYFENFPMKSRYRTDLKIKPEWSLSTMQLTPYFLEEIFVSGNQISRIRSYFGIQGEKGRWEPAWYLMIQSNRDKNSFTHMFVFGISLGYRL